MAYQSVNPYTGQVEKAFREHSAAEVDAAVAQAHGCFGAWRQTRFAERATVMARAAHLLRSRVDEFARPMTLEMGKRIAEARGEVELSADILDFYAVHAESFLAPQALAPRHGSAHVQSSPLGVLFGVQPWNFPYCQLARFAAPNLMAGNVVMVKHAASVPQCAEAFESLWREADAPAGAQTNLRISHDEVDRLIDDERVRGVALTGSVDTGRQVAARAGQAMK